MDDEIQLVSDGDGLAVIGEPAAVERFLASEGLPSTDLRLGRLTKTLSAGSALAQAGSELAVNSGRWVQLTKESAQQVAKHGLRQSSKTGLSTGVVKGSHGQVKGFVQFAKGPGAIASNPALLAGAAGIMAQLAMQQTMSEITDYLATIDQKLDDVLRAHQDAVLADMIGVGFDVDEAMTIREHGGGVNEVTWSKVQASSSTISRTQAYALRQLDALAEKIEGKTSIGDLAEAAKEAGLKVQGWLTVLARCFQLQDAVAVLELDRVLAVAPDDLDGHRLGLKAARQNRLGTISQTTEGLLARMGAAANLANTKVLLNPIQSPAIVRSSEHVAIAVTEFHRPLGIESDQGSHQARQWGEAAAEFKDGVLHTGAEGVDAAKRVGLETFGRAKSVTGRFSSGLADRTLRRRGNDEAAPEEAD